jgi:hypothetical protein
LKDQSTALIRELSRSPFVTEKKMPRVIEEETAIVRWNAKPNLLLLLIFGLQADKSGCPQRRRHFCEREIIRNNTLCQ